MLQRYLIWKTIIIICITSSLVVYGACTPHASTVGESIWKLLDRALSVSSANKVIYQTDVPYTISSSGAYSVGEDLTNTGTANVITVTNSSALLDLQGHAIIASANANNAIVASGGLIRNGFIMNFPVGFYVQADTPVIEALDFISCTTGIATGINRNIFAKYCTSSSCATFHAHTSSIPIFTSSLIIQNCDIFNCNDSAFNYRGASGAIIDQCTVQQSASILTANLSRGVLFSGCSFSNITNNGMVFSDSLQINLIWGLHVRYCQFDGIQGSAISLASGTQWAIIRDSIFSNITGTAIAIGSSTSYHAILRCRFNNINGIGISDISTTSSVYSNFFSGVGTPFAGGVPISRTPTNVNNNKVNFWQNIVDV